MRRNTDGDITVTPNLEHMRKALFCNAGQSATVTQGDQTTPAHSFAVSANDTHKDSDKVFLLALLLSHRSYVSLTLFPQGRRKRVDASIQEGAFQSHGGGRPI